MSGDLYNSPNFPIMNSVENPTKPNLRDVLAEIAASQGGSLTPDVVVDHASAKESPLHPYFEWDNSKAAKEFRLVQAAQLIRRVKVTYEKSDNATINVRAFVNVRDSKDDDLGSRGIYVPVETALTTPNYRDQLFRSANRDAKAFRTKYSALQEASEIIGAIDKVFPT